MLVGVGNPPTRPFPSDERDPSSLSTLRLEIMQAGVCRHGGEGYELWKRRTSVRWEHLSVAALCLGFPENAFRRLPRLFRLRLWSIPAAEARAFYMLSGKNQACE